MLFRRREPEGVWERFRTALWPRRSFTRSVQYLVKRVLRLTATPHAIAAGVAPKRTAITISDVRHTLATENQTSTNLSMDPNEHDNARKNININYEQAKTAADRRQDMNQRALS